MSKKALIEPQLERLIEYGEKEKKAAWLDLGSSDRDTCEINHDIGYWTAWIDSMQHVQRMFMDIDVASEIIGDDDSFELESKE